jgi:hypothetical protein
MGKLHPPDPLSAVPLLFPCDGPGFGTRFYSNGSLHTLPSIGLKEGDVDSTVKAIFICELISGLFFLHGNEIAHGRLTLRKLLLDDKPPLRINDWVAAALREFGFMQPGDVYSPVFSPREAWASPISFLGFAKVDIYSRGVIIYAVSWHADRDQFPIRIPLRALKWLRNLNESCLAGDPRMRPDIDKGL